MEHGPGRESNDQRDVGSNKEPNAASENDGTDHHVSQYIGRDGQPVRVLNFAGGGFDTVMQLGVAHALLVIQGRAPDAIVGVSAGAAQAVAVAEILQAGKHCIKDSSRRVSIAEYQRRRVERVNKFREMVSAAQKAPEELVDASLPDAYQIESHNPLQALRTSRFHSEERREREEQLTNRSGLIALYNDLLGIHLPIGIITRIVRRVLGWKAAEALPDSNKIKLRGLFAAYRQKQTNAERDRPEKSTRWPRRDECLVKFLELYRIWLLAGSALPRLVTAVPLILRPLFVNGFGLKMLSGLFSPSVATAGSLIFRVRTLRVALALIGYSIAFFLLASVWVAGSTLPAWIYYLIASHQHWKFNAPMIAALTVVIPVVPLLLSVSLPAVQVHETLKSRVKIRDALKEFAQFVITLVMYGIALSVIIHFVFGVELGVPKYLTDDHFYMTLIFPTSGVLVVALAIAVRVISPFWRGKKLGRRPSVESGDQLKSGHGYLEKWLNSYHLSKSFLHPHGLEKYLSDVFDPNYYGERDWGKVWEEALEENRATDRTVGGQQSQAPKITVRSYFDNRSPQIALGLAVADVGKHEIDVVDEDVPIIDALKAAMAWSPIFPPVWLKQKARDGERPMPKLYVDSMNVSSVPMPALLKLLRRRGVNRNATVIHVYRVASIPFSRPELPRALHARPMLNLIDIAWRAMKLQQLRDADLERKLTERFTRFIESPTVHEASAREQSAETAGCVGKGGERFRMWVAPIELTLPVGLNARILAASRDDRREEILKTIAKGCRASLEVMIAHSIKESRGDVFADRTIPCAVAVQHHVTEMIGKDTADNFGEFPLPGSLRASQDGVGCDANTAPGLAEICQYCMLGEESGNVPGKIRKKVLVANDWQDMAPSWPHELDEEALLRSERNDTHFVARSAPSPDPKILRALGKQWPSKRGELRNQGAEQASEPLTSRPIVSLLFSGGVFRGVHQIGVVNALHILGVKPDIVAGASVGSITAAIAAEILSERDVASDEAANKKSEKLARLAAAYLAVDNIILTDRFSDFIREFTIRAAGTRFSLRQADQLFRKYDQPWLMNFDKGARQVMGGIERLFYITPYQLNLLVKSIRHRRAKLAGKLTKDLAQQWLNRMGVGEEVLGAEALIDLIKTYLDEVIGDQEFCTQEQSNESAELRSVFASLFQKGVLFLATATDLTKGRLLTMGDPFNDDKQTTHAELMHALLASSAFPGVFRPRWAQEVFPGTAEQRQLIDGGVMDNLPMEAVVNLLWNASGGDQKIDDALIEKRPSWTPCSDQSDEASVAVPHLIFAASLEPKVDELNENQLADLANSWPQLRKRIQKLSYNFKLDLFAEAASEISALYKPFDVDRRVPLNLEVVAVKPEWLCETFAFHPMLGFRRPKQAESIAHGCAQTLLKFLEYKVRGKGDWLEAWGVRPEILLDLDDVFEDGIGQVDRDHLDAAAMEKLARDILKAARSKRDSRGSHDDGDCWLRKQGGKCPYSPGELSRLTLGANTQDELSRIHTSCSMEKTHLPH